MKLSDKALRQIGRKLLDRTDTHTNQDDSPFPGKAPATRCGGLDQGTCGDPPAAAVLPFKKRER